MTRGFRRAAIAVLPALVLALSACGADQDGPKVASVDKPADASPSASAAAVDPNEMGVKFAQCLREQGLDIPDPEPGQPVRFRFDKSVGREKVEAAMETCREFNPQANGSPEQDAQQAERGRQFAGCMRENGVEAFPDPDPAQPGIRITPEIGEDPDFPAAQKACEGVLSGGTPGQR
ncbi:hypothetical protein ACFYL6_19170 [Micromonospora sp. NPDC007208]|uniref:hypothetical protein n=1 Tax=Micromonospora sp. NPDC007208 TaxID=3364236 RepID=UPI0036873E3D